MEVEDLAQQLAFLTRDERTQRRAADQAGDLAERLTRVVDLASRCIDHDPKLDAARSNRSVPSRPRHPNANANPHLHEATPTSLKRLQERLVAEAFGPVLTLQGADDEQTRRETTTAFRTRSRVLLVATDAASEGLNLHERCHHLIHLELPWNPNRPRTRATLHRPLRSVDGAGSALPLPSAGKIRGACSGYAWSAKYERQPAANLRFVHRTTPGLGLLEMPDENVFGEAASGRALRR